MQSNRDQYGWNPDARESWLVGLFWDGWDQAVSLLGSMALGMLALIGMLLILLVIYWAEAAGYRKVNRDFRDRLACPDCGDEMERIQSPWGPLILTCKHGMDDPYKETSLMSSGDAIAAAMKKGGRS